MSTPSCVSRSLTGELERRLRQSVGFTGLTTIGGDVCVHLVLQAERKASAPNDILRINQIVPLTLELARELLVADAYADFDVA